MNITPVATGYANEVEVEVTQGLHKLIGIITVDEAREIMERFRLAIEAAK